MCFADSANVRTGEAVDELDPGQHADNLGAGVVVQDLSESLEQAIQRADEATYAAKRSGKNRVVTG